MDQQLFAFRFDPFRRKFVSYMDIDIDNPPLECNWKAWEMLGNGINLRLFCRHLEAPDVLYQFGFNGRCMVLGFNCEEKVFLPAIPRQADRNSFSILHDGALYRLFIPDRLDKDLLHQFIFNGKAFATLAGSQAILRLRGLPERADRNRCAMLNGGGAYHYFALDEQNADLLHHTIYRQETSTFDATERLRISGLDSNLDTSAIGMAFFENTNWLFFRKKPQQIT